MAIKDISAAWKTYLEGNNKMRFYFNPRQIVYPNIAGAAQFTAVDAWRYGTHDLTDNYATYYYQMPTSFTFEVLVYPNFAYDTAADQTIFSWYWSATSYFKLYYNATDDKFRVEYIDGGTARYLESQQFDNGAAHEDISQWLTFTGAIDLTTGTTAGSQFWVNRTSVDTAWDGNIDTPTINYNKLVVRALVTTEGDYKINHLRIIPSYVATDTIVQNAFRDVYNAEIFFPFNGIPLGYERCQISKFVTKYGISEKAEKDNGSFCANTASLTLTNEGIAGATGCFCDDQYAAFTPASYQYNGTSAQAYLKNRIPFWIESWYGNSFDSVFIGRVNENAFHRSKRPESLSRISISLEDAIVDIATKTKKKTKWYDSYDLCNTASESSSLMHVIARLATKEDIYNYIADGYFDKATITNSWAEGANCTLTRDNTQLLIGSYNGKAVFSGAGSFYQDVTFQGEKNLNVGESYVFSMFILSADPFEGDIKIGERDSGGENDGTSATVSIAGGEGYTRFEVVHTITDADSDTLRLEVLSDAADTIYMSWAMHLQGSTNSNYVVASTQEGTAGVFDADDAGSSGYDTIGFVVTDNTLECPWVRIESGDSLWEYLKDIADATPNLQYLGMDTCGNLEYRHTASEGGDPSSTETITVVNEVVTKLEPTQANKVVVSGAYIVEETADHELWNAKADSGLTLPAWVNDGAVWPPEATYGNYDAEVGKIE